MEDNKFVRGYIEGKMYEYVSTGFNLSYEQAKELANEGNYISRLEWDGFHFVDVAPDGEKTYVVVLKTGEMLFNPREIYDTDKNDWGVVNIINKKIRFEMGKAIVEE